MHACTCECTCLGIPPMPPDASQPICPLPRAAGSPNHWKFISPELINIVPFCLKNLYLWTFLNSSRLMLITLDTPLHTCQSRNLKNAIKRIKIIEFCLKICDPWALLHTYRLGLICRWGVSHPKWHFYVSSPIMCPLQIINWHWTPIIDPSWGKWDVYLPPI